MKPETKKIKKIVGTAVTILLLLLIVGWGIPNMNLGIDVQDTSSYLTKYRYFFHRGVGGNALYYLAGEFLGSLIFRLSPTLLAMNIANYVVYLLCGAVFYRIMKKYLPVIPLLSAVLGGTAFAVSWVRCLNWNSWSMLFLMLGIYFIQKGFETGRRKWISYAGVILGWNAFVRIPNLIFLSLVLVVFVYYVSEGIGKAFSRSFTMAGGGIFAGITGVIFSIRFLGFDKFRADLLWLLSSGGDTGSKHNFFSMFQNLYLSIRDGALQWIKYGAVLAVLIVFCVVLEKKLHRDLTAPAGVLAGVAALALGFTREVTYSSCITLLSVQNFIALGGVLAGIFGAFYYYGKKKQFACLCLAEAIVMLTLTIGTDTGSIYFRVCMGLPAAVLAAVVWNLGLQKAGGLRTEGPGCEAAPYRWYRSMRIIAVFVLVLTAATGLNCGWNYVYHDSSAAELTAEIDAPVFAGMKTSPERADYVNRLIELLKPYSDEELLTIGAFNVGCNVTDMEPFFDSAWSDLDYLSMEEFNRVLAEKLGAGNYPVIVIATTKINGDYWVPEKIEILETLVQGSNYETIYSDSWYRVYVPVK